LAQPPPSAHLEDARQNHKFDRDLLSTHLRDGTRSPQGPISPNENVCIGGIAKAPAGLANAPSHGFSEVLYAFASMIGLKGSASGKRKSGGVTAALAPAAG
jgi:hypothetical protein